MKFKRYVIIISSTILTFLISGIIGFTQENNFEKQETALRIIKDFANDFCQDPNLKLSGHEDNLELSGKAKAEINNLIKKLVDIGIEGAAKYSEHYYEGVLQKDLAEMLRNEHECKMKIWDDLEKKLMPPLPEKETKPKYNENKENVEETIWKIDDTGVCRDNDGYYPRWTAYNWNLKQCADACLRNLNCQGFAMSKTQNYCQLMGSDGSRSASKPGTRITRGDSSQPQYTCYLKRLAYPSKWKIDPTGVCRDNNGFYPKWTAYNWTIEQCEANCLSNPNCQGFAMSKTQNYCQLMGSDGSRSASKPGTRITRGDSSQPKYTCYLKR